MALFAHYSCASATSPMLRAFDPEVDGKADANAAVRYRVVSGERICGWSCDTTSPHYERDKHLCPAECVGGRLLPRAARPTHKKRKKKAMERLDEVCPGPAPATPAPALPLGRRPHCSDGADVLNRAGVFLFVGVQSGPRHQGRRSSIRRSWMRWDNVGRTALVCFILGRRGLGPESLAELDAEAAAHGDIFWLPNATDEGVPTLKGYAYWSAAARLLPPPGATAGIAHVAKVDDDAFLHLPNLESDLRRLHCAPHLHYGHLAFTGYNPAVWRMCGWSWQPYGANYAREECAANGAYPPFPFMNGALELLSTPLVRYIATEPRVLDFVGRAERAIASRKAAGFSMTSYARADKGPRVWRQNEDIALGFWLSRAELAGQFNVTWVRVNDRAINMACISTKGMYQRPRDDSVIVHFLKKPAGVRYVWGLLHDRVAHTSDNCTRYVWYDNCEGQQRDVAYCKAHPEPPPAADGAVGR